MDDRWWRETYNEVVRVFHGERWTSSTLFSQYRVRKVKRAQLMQFNNSGSGTIALAAFAGASRILLLGFDFQHTNGERHWHGDHPPTLGNASSVKKWHRCMPGIRAGLESSGIEVWNCTRETALDWPRMDLEQALDRTRAQQVPPDVGAGELPRALAGPAASSPGAELAAP